jgi:serine/threonine-protein phosphatase 2A regulatory subunit B
MDVEGASAAASSSASAAAAANAAAAATWSASPSGPVEYRFHTEFQSHEAEFDYLKSLEIEEKINQIAWCKRAGSSLMLLSTNDKTIKLWKVAEKRAKAVTAFNVEVGRYGGRVPVSSLRIPSLIHGEVQTVASCRRVYSNAHAYHVNSISVNPDGATFLSADDLRINLWSLDNAKLSFNVVDIKPPTLEELTEVITSADFHPSEPHTFMFSSSRGAIKVGDMREAALCDKRAKGA